MVTCTFEFVECHNRHYWGERAFAAAHAMKLHVHTNTAAASEWHQTKSPPFRDLCVWGVGGKTLKEVRFSQKSFPYFPPPASWREDSLCVYLCVCTTKVWWWNADKVLHKYPFCQAGRAIGSGTSGNTSTTNQDESGRGWLVMFLSPCTNSTSSSNITLQIVRRRVTTVSTVAANQRKGWMDIADFPAHRTKARCCSLYFVVRLASCVWECIFFVRVTLCYGFIGEVDNK